MARQMKDSGVEWIGEIPACWELRPARYAFSEVKDKNTDGIETHALQFRFGKIIAKTDFNAEDDNYVADTITNYTIVDPRTIMINGLNLNYDFKTQRVALVTERGVITSAYLALRPDERLIDAEYATYLFKGYESKMALHNMGAGIRLTLGYREFKNQPVLFPMLCEQKRIIAFLDHRCAEIVAVIERTKATIEEYKKLKQAVITEAVTKGVRGSRKMKDSGMTWVKEIPEEWENRKMISVLAMRVVDGPHESPELFETGIPYISANAIDNGKIDFDKKRGFISEEYCDLCDKRYTPQRNDLLVIKLGATTGQVAIVETDERFNIWVPLAALRCNNLAIPRFIYYAMQSNYYVRQMELSWTFGTQQTLGVKTIERLRILLPSVEEQQEIVEYLGLRSERLDTLIAKKTALLTELETYKKSLVYEYVTGKKEVV